MVTVFNSEIQKPETSELIELFTLDLTALGDSIYFFTPNKKETDIEWQGNVYVSVDIQAEGFEVDGRGSAPTPKIRFSMTTPILGGLIDEFNDLIGAKITRCKTYAKFLDGEPGANPSAHFPLDIYRVERKASETRYQIEFELSSIMDQRGATLPSRVITSFYCPWIYRRHNGGSSGDPLLDFNYHPADNGCPYQGNDYFDTNGDACDADEDKCAKSENACKLRFGEDAVLPFGGFPGAARPVIA
jgi:lambda family phage minor tail protein L